MLIRSPRYFLLSNVGLFLNTRDEGAVIDMQDVFLRLSFDITCKLVFGTDPASLSPDFHVVPFSRAIDEVMAVTLRRHAVPASWWKMMRRLRLGGERRHAEAIVVIDNFIAESIRKRKQEAAAEGSLNESLLTAYIKEDTTAVDKFLRDTTVNLLIAGRDTIGVALAWFFYLLCVNPEKEGRIVDELRDGGGGVYLEAAILESLRLYPPVPFEAKGVGEEERLPSGHRVEPGMQVLFSTYTMGRMEGVWGKDCGEFRPERWITEQGRVRRVPAYKFFSFNCGPRTCLGKGIAMVELKEAAAAVVRGFKLEMVEGHVVEPKLSIMLQMRNGLKVRVRCRE